MSRVTVSFRHFSHAEYAELWEYFSLRILRILRETDMRILREIDTAYFVWCRVHWL